MAKIIDIRALQGGGRSGVEVYVEGFLYDFFKVKKVHESEDVILWVNAAGNVVLPGFLDDYVNLPNVRLVRTKIPNKILNLCCSVLRWPKIDKVLCFPEVSCASEVFVLDPRPCPVSKNVKKNIVVHDLSSVKFPQFFSFRSKLWFLTVRLKKELMEAEQIYAVSNFTKSEITAFEPSLEGKIFVKYPVLASDRGVKRVAEEFLRRSRAKYKIPDKPFLFTISTLEPRKNIETVIAKFLQRDFPNCEYLVIAGECNDKIFKTERYASDNSVIFTGRIGEDEKFAFYNLASGFICLSHYEGFGIPVKDAMNFKLPLILSDIPVFREIVGDYKDVTWVRI